MGLNKTILARIIASMGSAGSAPYLGQVATKSDISYNYSSVNKQFNSRSPHTARDNISSVKVGIPGWYVSAALVQTALTGTTTAKVTVEYPAGTYSASASGTVPNGGVLDLDVPVAIPDGVDFWVHTRWDSTDGIVANSIQDLYNGGYFQYAASGLADNTGGAGTLTNTDNVWKFTPLYILGMTRKRSVLIIGSSSSAGTGDTAGVFGDIGSIARHIGPANGYIKAGVPGDHLVNLLAANGAQRRALAQYVTDIVINMGMNDLQANRTFAQVSGDLTSFAALMSGKQIHLLTNQPRTTSTDNWTTDANQTLGFTGPQEQARVDVNTWIMTHPAGFANVIDQDGTLRSITATNKWRSDFGQLTTDGSHSRHTGTVLMSYSDAIWPSAIGARPVMRLDPSRMGPNKTILNKGKTLHQASSGYGAAMSAASKTTGKFYFEVVAGAGGTVGLNNISANLSAFSGADANGIGYHQSGVVRINNVTLVTMPTFTTGDTLRVAVDLDNAKIWFAKAGSTWNNSDTANPVTNVSGIDISGITGPKYAALSISTGDWTINFQMSDWAYTAPSGFSDWN